MNRRDFSRMLGMGAFGQSLLRSQAQTVAHSAKPFHFSLMLWALEKQAPLDRCIEMAAAAGYQGVELVGEFQTWSPEEKRRIMGRVHSLGLVVDSMSGVKAGFAVPEVSSEFLAQVARQISSATELGCTQIILLSGNKVDGLESVVQQKTAVDNLKRVADLAMKQGIEIVIEPIDPIENPAIFMNSVTQGSAIVEEVGSGNVKLLYDFYHEQRGAGNLIEKLEKNIDRVGLVHIADVPGRHEPGTGEIDYTNIYRKLAELHYNRYIAMEYYPTGDVIKSLTESRIHAEQAMSTVR